MEIVLFEALKKELEALLENVELLNPTRKTTDGKELKYKPIKVYIQELPTTQSEDGEDEDEYISLAPYIIIQSFGSKHATERSINVVFVMCIYDDSPERQGAIDLLRLKEQIIKRFGENPIIQQFEAAEEWEWELLDEDTHPFYFGGLKMTFSAPPYQKTNQYL